MKKLLATLLATTMAVSAIGGLVACGGDEEKIDYNVTIWGPDGAQTYYEGLITQFQTANEQYKDYTITYVAKGEGDVKDALATDPKKGADLFFFESGQIAEMIDTNLLQPLTGSYSSYADSVKARDTGAYVTAATRNDKLYAFPATGDNTWFMWYDSEWAEEKDVDLDDFDDIVAKSKASGKKIALPYNNGWYVTAFFFGTGCTIDYVGKDYKVDITGANGDIACEALYKYLVQEKSTIYAPEDANLNTAAADGITDGSVSVGFIGTWVAGDMPEKAKATDTPKFTVNGTKYDMLSFSGAKYCGVNPRRGNKKLCVALADYLTNEAAQQGRFNQLKAAPTNKNVAVSDAVKSDMVVSAVMAQNAHCYVQGRHDQSMWDNFKNLGNAIASGEVATLAAVKSYVAEVKTACEEAGKLD